MAEENGLSMGNEANMAAKEDIDFTLTNVPKEHSKNWYSIFIVLLGFTFLSTTMAAGASIGVAFKYSELMKILAVGCVILAGYAGCISLVAARTKLTTFVLARFALGKIGAKWADILLGGTQIIWYAVQTAYMGLLFTKGLGLERYFIPITIFWGLAMGATAIRGTKGMEIIANISLLPFLYLAIKLPVLSISTAGGYEAMTQIIPQGATMTFTAAITIVIGTFISGATNTPNWARFAKTQWQGFTAGFAGFFIGTFVMVVSGMLGGLCIRNGDMIEVMISLGIVVMAIVILIFNIWTTNTATAYAIGVSGSEFFNKSNKEPFVIGGILLGTLIAILGIYDVFIPFLVWLGIFIPPMGGIIFGDHFAYWRKAFPKIEYVKFRTYRAANWIAYILASVFAIITARVEFGIPSINGFVSAIILVFVMQMIFNAANIEDNHKIAENAEYIYND